MIKFPRKQNEDLSTRSIQSLSQSIILKDKAREYTRPIDSEELKKRIEKFFIPQPKIIIKNQEWLKEAMILRREMIDQKKYFDESIKEINQSIIYEFGKDKKNHYLKENEIEKMLDEEKDKLIISSAEEVVLVISFFSSETDDNLDEYIKENIDGMSKLRITTEESAADDIASAMEEVSGEYEHWRDTFLELMIKKALQAERYELPDEDHTLVREWLLTEKEKFEKDITNEKTIGRMTREVDPVLVFWSAFEGLVKKAKNREALFGVKYIGKGFFLVSWKRLFAFCVPDDEADDSYFRIALEGDIHLRKWADGENEDVTCYQIFYD